MTLPLELLETLLSRELALHVWPFFRIAGAMMVAPVFGARPVPARIRLALGIGTTMAVAPLVPASQAFEASFVSALLVLQEVLLGVAMGFCVQMLFDALIIAGQSIAMGMGLGFAMMVDPQRGISVPVVSQFFVILGTLIFLSLGGHLAVVRMIADSFTLLPIGQPLPTDGLWLLVGFGSQMFAGALRIALPAMTALLIVNIAFGVVSRAAPTLNLFAVGLPASLLVGFLLLIVNIGHLSALLGELLSSALSTIVAMLSA
jgi:flagellar biosynthetic protein FliR